MVTTHNLERLVDDLAPGTLTLVVGAPQAGVSTTLARVVRTSAERGLPSALACWERPAAAMRALIGDARATVADGAMDAPSRDRLRDQRWLPDLLESLCPAVGTVLAVDYLGLWLGYADPPNVFADLVDVVHRRGSAMVLGAMARRDMRDLPTPEVALEVVAAGLDRLRADAAAVDRLTVLLLQNDGSRLLACSETTPDLFRLAYVVRMPLEL